MERVHTDLPFTACVELVENYYLYPTLASV